MRPWVLSFVLVLAACTPPYDAVLPMPEQGPVLEDGPVLDASGRIIRLATFSSTTLVLRREEYDRDLRQDPLSEFSSLDLVMAWGRAGLRIGRDGVRIAQGHRRYGWEAWGETWARSDVRSFGANSANWHMIPADAEVADRLDDLGKGDVVRITGDLVSVRARDGTVIRSSTRRDDSGDGACEIVRVIGVEIIEG